MFLDLKMSPGFAWKITVCKTVKFLATDNKTLEKDVFFDWLMVTDLHILNDDFIRMSWSGFKRFVFLLLRFSSTTCQKPVIPVEIGNQHVEVRLGRSNNKMAPQQK